MKTVCSSFVVKPRRQGMNQLLIEGPETSSSSSSAAFSEQLKDVEYHSAPIVLLG